MKINLFINFYLDKNLFRQAELDFSLNSNIKNKLINVIFIFGDDLAISYCKENFKIDKLSFFTKEERPTYNDYFSVMDNYPHRINILANSDIYFDNTLLLIKEQPFIKTNCFALSRWDYVNGEIKHYDEKCSQDCWVFFGNMVKIKDADFSLGILGCDNRISYLLKKSNYIVTNPSKSIRCIHFHGSNIRNYIRDEKDDNFERIDGPYLFIEPIELN